MSRAGVLVGPSLGTESGLTALEPGSRGQEVNVDYVQLLSLLLIRSEPGQRPLDEDAANDREPARGLHRLCFLTKPAHMGKRTPAALMHREPHFSRAGPGALSRTLRAPAV